MLTISGLLLLLVATWWAREGEEPAQWVALERCDLSLTVPVEGVLEAVDSASITPPAVPQIWNFKIAMLAPEGIEVEAGQPVVGFDTSELRQRLRTSTGERESAEGQLEKRLSELDIERQNLELELAEAEARLRREALRLQVPEGLVAARELATARVDHDLAQLEVESLQERLELLARRSRAEVAALERRRDRAAQRVDELGANLQAMQVKAPRAGTIIYAQNRGEKPRVGDSVWRAQTLLEIPDLSAMVGRGQVDESEAGQLAVGQRVEFELDAHPGRPVFGVIQTLHESLGPKSDSDPTKVVAIEVALEATDPETMRPGMRFRGSVELERVEQAVCLPSGAPQWAPEGPVVVVHQAVGERLVVPKLGRRNAEYFEVLEGLEAGDRVGLGGGSS